MAYVKKDWEGLPSTETPVTADDLDRIENGVEYNDQRLNGTKNINNTIYANDFKCKNLISVTVSNKTTNGITFTNNGDGTITVNGTASADASFNIYTNNLNIKAGTYTLSGCPNGGASAKYYMATNIPGSTVYDYGEDVSITIPSDTTNRSIWMVIKSGQTVSNLVFKPQLEIGSEATPFTPYKNFDATDILSYQKGRIKFNFSTNLTSFFDNQGDKTLYWTGFMQNATDSPDASASGIVISFRDLSAWGWQMAIYNGKIRIRQKQNGTWGNWVASA